MGKGLTRAWVIGAWCVSASRLTHAPKDTWAQVAWVAALVAATFWLVRNPPPQEQ